MEKMTVIQVSLSVIFAAAFSGMLFFTDVYSDIKATIVDTICLSCIKMDPVSKIRFDPSYDNPDFVIENLSKGPIFLAFRSDVCTACDVMEPVLKDIFDVEFGLKELFYDTVDYQGKNIVFYHINKDPPIEPETESFFAYDKDKRDAVPMFVMITLGNNSGTIQPYFSTAYGTLGKNNDRERREFLEEMINTGFALYDENVEYFQNH